MAAGVGLVATASLEAFWETASVVPPPLGIVVGGVVSGSARPVLTQEDHWLFVVVDMHDRVHDVAEDRGVARNGDLEFDHWKRLGRSGCEVFDMGGCRGPRRRAGSFLAES